MEILHSKLSKNLGIIRKLSYSLPVYTLKTLYNVLIMPHIDYCNVVWAVSPNKWISRIHVIQKKAVRLIAGYKRGVHSPPIFRQLDILTIFDVNKLQTACFVFQATKNTLPSIFDNYYQFCCLFHTHVSRHSQNIYTIYCRTRTRQNTIRYRGAII